MVLQLPRGTWGLAGSQILGTVALGRTGQGPQWGNGLRSLGHPVPPHAMPHSSPCTPLSFQVALHAGSSCRRDAAPLGKRN